MAMIREAIAVLAAILVAFALDAWWDNWTDRQDAVIALTSLQTELADNLLAIDSTVAKDSAAIDAVRALVDLSPSEMATRSVAELRTDFRGLAGFVELQPEMGALNSQLSSGALMAVDDPALRSEIAGLPQDWDEVTEEGDIALGLWVEVARQMVITAGPDRMLGFDSSAAGPIREAMTAFVGSRDFLDAAGVAAIFTEIYVSELRDERAALVELSDRVGAELAR